MQHFALTFAILAGTSVAMPTQLKGRNGDSYTFYQGDGSTNAGWPSQDQWSSYNDLWNANVPLMQQSCGWNGWGDNDSADEINSIQNAIQTQASSTGLDARFILAIMMQESKGCVRVPTTNNGVRNPGLMQDHDGSGTCNDNGNVQNPCPDYEIAQMIADGAAGTSQGDGLQQTQSQAQSATGDNGSRAYYAAARLYNSGSADYSNLDNGLGSTPCYASDVANRLTGWTLAASNCQA
ncbi:Hypothetical protein R9X50_00768500 [Acrodontium crateriforme]|uniref:Uncharacterized protein n=1 Tax=Acrodontium crateriforme TaxID=150365 RepID=A0AAQ3MAJ4_9PEZI|nr:Hypothetical protein R9X50_00768500 [Acrodontium crateriforme]